MHAFFKASEDSKKVNKTGPDSIVFLDFDGTLTKISGRHLLRPYSSIDPLSQLLEDEKKGKFKDFLLPGAIDFIKALLRKNIKVIINSNNFSKFIIAILSSAGLDENDFKKISIFGRDENFELLRSLAIKAPGMEKLNALSCEMKLGADLNAVKMLRIFDERGGANYIFDDDSRFIRLCETLERLKNIGIRCSCEKPGRFDWKANLEILEKLGLSALAKDEAGKAGTVKVGVKKINVPAVCVAEGLTLDSLRISIPSESDPLTTGHPGPGRRSPL